MNSDNVILIDNYIPYVQKIARLMSNSMSFIDFDDAVQDGLLGLMKAVEDFDSLRPVSFKSYAYKIIKRSITQGAVSLKEYKYNRKEGFYEPIILLSSIDDEVDTEIVDPKKNGLQTMIFKENKKSLQSAINILSREEQDVIRLKYFSGMKLKEISLLKEVTSARISQIHKKALEKMREEMERA